VVFRGEVKQSFLQVLILLNYGLVHFIFFGPGQRLLGSAVPDLVLAGGTQLERWLVPEDFVLGKTASSFSPGAMSRVTAWLVGTDFQHHRASSF